MISLLIALTVGQCDLRTGVCTKPQGFFARRHQTYYTIPQPQPQPQPQTPVSYYYVPPQQRAPASYYYAAPAAPAAPAALRLLQPGKCCPACHCNEPVASRKDDGPPPLAATELLASSGVPSLW
jgi:hypothetical protein